jgi:carbon monoxide dehydrogenase subunit G
MLAVEANKGESDGDKSVLDIMVATFTGSRTCSQPPEHFHLRIASPSSAVPTVAFPVLHSFVGWAATPEKAFLVAIQRLIPAAQQWRPAPMAMTMNGEVQLSATRDKVWAMLNDPEVLKVCIPGCEMLDKNADNEFQAIASVKVGPVKARWKGKVKLTDIDPPNSYRIVGEGEGGVAGFAKGNAKVSLSDKEGGTLLSYDVEAQIGGKLAQLGQRLINSAAKKTADDFFLKFAAAVAPK